ncbi:serine/arginine repetitive matrix protein 5-like isoform X2 [Gymnodraco acuticeps]|uniref:Serine/arginine repetitive matrix protein 5-like isoform X2 n=1 Tax=Gymnodraco acuticeps TaxID=8218 RepID=A0A6P8V4P4_GYMAC|nr:serine/arginine repetitive matrix protein 5-like isoform X2 [Gymnodraco acuticeps]
MTCGVHLGIFLIVLVQAEHVRCLWASQAQSKNNNTYVGFRQNNREAGVNYLQNRRRQALSRNLNIPSAVGGRFSWGPSTGGYTQTVSQPTKSGLAKVRLVQGSSVSKPNLNRVPKQRFHGLSSAIAGSDSLSKSSNKDTGKSSSLFGAGAPEPNQTPARTKTSSSVRAKLVSKTAKSSRPSAPKNPSQTEVVNPYKSKLFSGNAGNARGSYKAISMASSYGTDSKSSREGTSGKKFAPTKTHIIPDKFGGYAIRRLKAPGQEKVSVRKPQQQTPNKAYNAPRQQIPNKAYEAPNKAYNAPRQQIPNKAYVAPNTAYNAPQQQTPNRAYETSNMVYNAPQQQAPNRAYNAPQQQTPNKAYNAPQQQTPNKAYETPNRTPNRAYETPNRAYETPNRPYKTPKKAYVAPQRQATNQAYEAPNRAYVAPQRQAEPQTYIFPQVAPPKPQVPSAHINAKWFRVSPKWGQ